MSRGDGTFDEIIPQKVHADGYIPAASANIEDINVEIILKSMLEIGKELADAKAKFILQKVDDVCKRTGNIVETSNNLIEQIFLSIEKREIDFDRNLNPLLGEMVVHPNMVETVRTAWKQIDSTPDLQKRMRNLIELKRREFLDRETTRQLVD